MGDRLHGAREQMTLRCFPARGIWRWSALSVLALSAASSARAQETDVGAFSPNSSHDLASTFISFLFGSGDVPDNSLFAAAHLGAVAEGLRHAMSIYGLAMLVLAGFLLFYHVVSMVADTAHQGVVLGKRTNQVWAPIRLVIAIVLLVPIGSGLSIGQHVVLKIAMSGSNMASHAWESAASPLRSHFYGLVTPRGPDVSSFVARSLEMELCHTIYEQARAVQPTAPGVRLAGNMGDILRIPATPMAPETWRYTNLLNASIPMCGEYRFSGFRLLRVGHAVSNDTIGHIADDISTFSHAEAEVTLTQAHMIAAYAAPAFNGNDLAALPTIHDDFLSLRHTVQQQLDNHLQVLSAAQAAVAAKYLAQNDGAGWIAAAFFIPNLVRAQESYGELVDHILPDVQEPVFVHRALTQQVMSDALGAEPALRGADHDVGDDLFRFYGRVSHINARMQDWLYGSVTDEMSFVASSGFDLRDQINPATDAPAAFSLFARMIDNGAITHGVWGRGGEGRDAGNPFGFAMRTDNFNPFTSLIEFGRRQFDLGIFLVGLSGSVMAVPQILMPSLFVSVLGILFVVGGLGLVFVIPLLPFVRFLLAVLVWMVELLEALVAVPLVAIAHLTPTGEGLSGGVARQAYLLWISLAIRPILTVFGLLAGALIFALGLFLLLAGFMPLMQLASSANSGILIVANTGLVLIYDVLAYAIANVAFRGINQLPDQALRWISPFVVTEVGKETSSTASATATATGSPVSAFMEKMSHYTMRGGAGSAAGAHTSSPNDTRHSPLFPLYRQDAETAALSKRSEVNKSATSTAANNAASTNVNVAVTPVIVDRSKPEKDKKKKPGEPSGETPHHPDKDPPPQA